MREVLSVFTFGIGALCFVVFVTVFPVRGCPSTHLTEANQLLNTTSDTRFVPSNCVDVDRQIKADVGG
jgi:hypothetical protein